jgi:SAM-dependent methyltransferase
MDIECRICKKPISAEDTFDIYDTRFGYPDTFQVLHCPRCDFRQTSPTLSDDVLGDLYTHYYPRRSLDPAKVVASCDTRDDASAKRRRWFGGILYKCFYHVPAGKRVLDIGCGNGQSLVFLKAKGCEVYGIEEDRNIQPVAEALGVSVEAGNIYTSTYPDHSFDYILASQVLEHIPDPVRFLKAVKQKLAPGGKILLSFPNTRSLTRWIFRKRWIHWHIPYHLNHFSPKSLPALFSAAGLRYTGFKTITPTDWTILQVRDACMPVPKQGQSHPLWKKDSAQEQDNQPTSAKPGWSARKMIARTARWTLNSMNRLIDACGLGSE